MLFFKLLKGEWVSLGVSFLLVGAFTAATAAPLSWQLHMPEASNETQSQPEALAQPSADSAEAQWRSDVIAQLLAKNITGALQLLNTASTQGAPVSLLTSRAAWLFGLGLVPWADTTLEEAARHSNQLDSTQQKALQYLKTSFKAVYATEQLPTAVVRDCANILPALLGDNPNNKAYQQWQVLEGPERLSIAVKRQRQELALLGPTLVEPSISSPVSDELLFPASLKPSLVEVINTLKASQQMLNDSAGAVEIGLNQRRLTPIEYSHQREELIGFLALQQKRVAGYRSRLERRVASLPSGNAQLLQWKNAANEAVALVTLHEAALAALRESIEPPVYHSMLQSNRPKTFIAIVEQLPVLEKSVMQHLQASLNTWDSISVAQAMLESDLPISFSKALVLGTVLRVERIPAMPLKPADDLKTTEKKSTKDKKVSDSEKSNASKTADTQP
ncbi:MAG: hypothetical protein QE263_05345 [Vampirovibrionales bacterium]|nr:hypothetical protein [Vampirovibrionales bacterium]